MRNRLYQLIPVSTIRVALLVFFIALLIGCSGTTEPLSPETNPPASLNAAGENSGRMSWGLYAGYADTDKGEFGLTPMRSVDMHVNLVSTLNTTAGVSAQILWGESNPGAGMYKVRVTIHHPYAGTPKFSGFDVRGIFISGASEFLGQGLWIPGDARPKLLNPDGYTRWWNPLEFPDAGMFGYTNGNLGSPTPAAFDALLNGYKVFADAFPSETDDDLMWLTFPELDADGGRGVFTSSSITRRYEIQFPPGISYFNYAIDASWAAPSSNPPQVPDDFPPNANCPEAWWVRCDIIENTLKYYTDLGISEGSLSVYVSVFDWQGRMNGIVAPETIMVKLFSDGLMGSSYATASLTYDDGISALYQANLTPYCDPDSAGTYLLGIEVVSAGGTYKQSWQDAPSNAVAAYQVIEIEVEPTVYTPDLMKTFGICAWVLRKSDGSGAAYSDTEIAWDIAYANDFWNDYGFGFELAKKMYIDNNTYYNLDPYDCESLYYWNHDTTGLINLYYVNSIVGEGGAFAIMGCEYFQTAAKDTYIVFDSNDNYGWEEVLSHELGHNIGMLEDLYWLYYGYSCAEVEYAFCGYYDTDIYCNPSDEGLGNLMYFLNVDPWTPAWWYDISSYDIEMNTSAINSQAENVAYFHTHYPGNFKDMG